jgi:hypothetical protein
MSCELSLDPEVAILFGREIGQSNGVFYLLIAGICKDKSRPVTCITKCCLKLLLRFFNDYFYELIGWRKSDNFPV